MIVKPAVSFIQTDTDPQLLTDTTTIVTSMTDNAVYTAPTPTLPVITAAAGDFSTAIANAVNGGTELTAIKKQKRAALGTLLRELAAYVSVACKGSMAS